MEYELKIGKTGEKETNLEAMLFNGLGEGGGKSALDQFGWECREGSGFGRHLQDSFE